jgi:energy-coupling factor transporter ATP-binding protein EcfA2
MRSGATALGKLPDLAALQAGSVRLADLRDGAEAAAASSASPDGALALEAVSFDHGDRRVLDNVTMRIDPGQKVLIVGANGSGKTTLAHLLAGFLHGRGDTRVQGLERVSAMLNPLRFAPCSLGQHLRLPPDGPARAEALALLRELDLADRLDDDPETFSDGLKRRAYTAMVLLKEAGVYIFDEPLAAVDEPGKERLMAAIEARTRDKTVISIMHGDQRFWGMFQRTIRLEPPAAAAP